MAYNVLDAQNYVIFVSLENSQSAKQRSIITWGIYVIFKMIATR